uniref:Macaca fascicularis brain cDNA, clone: QtrA-18044 n=2 Tax=Macaca TaxID=9539 RepID=I7GM39_MACFA|nr:unnamed protein product [Macaca fascicularis]
MSSSRKKQVCGKYVGEREEESTLGNLQVGTRVPPTPIPPHVFLNTCFSYNLEVNLSIWEI